ncbi:MAG: serine hydrolase [Planctomycetota bacterium]
MKRTTKRVLLAVFGIALVAVLAVGTYGFWPFVNRSLVSAAPTPMPTSLIADAQPVIDFIEQDARGIDACIVHHNGKVVFSHGAVDVPMNTASVRKSVLSLLYGIAWDRGLIDLGKTVGELDINESRTSLTDGEKTATIEHLLQARSGIYLPSGGEGDNAKDRPTREQYAPGEHFYYNSWDFNVVGHVFEAETGLTIGQAIDQWLARPLGMEDFHPSHVVYDSDGNSDYRTYRIHMSARDLARLGTLVIQDGAWQGEQIVSADWLTRSTTPSSSLPPRDNGLACDGYGYLWWTSSSLDAIFADGWGGQYMMIDPKTGLVVVNRRDIGNSRVGYLRFVATEDEGVPWDTLSVRDLVQQQLEPTRGEAGSEKAEEAGTQQ